jgi:DNA invertase Pin-like site-specific DNA recombinase
MPRRVARSTRDLLNTLAQIAERKAGFRSLADTGRHNQLAMLIVLGALAKFERDLICTRTGEGRARARVNGMKMGRKPRLSPYLQCEAIRRRDRGQEILAVIGRSYNVSGWTLSKLKS